MFKIFRETKANDKDNSSTLYRLALAPASPSQGGRNTYRQTRSTQDTIDLSIVFRIESLDSLIAAVDALAHSFVRENLSRSSRALLTRHTFYRLLVASLQGGVHELEKNAAGREAAGRLKARYSYPALLLLTP